MGFSKAQVTHWQRQIAQNTGAQIPVKNRKQKPAAINRADEFVSKCRLYGVPEPTTEYRFNPRRRWRLDYCWPLQKVALEVEGAVWVQGRHTRGSGFVKDMEKYNALAAQGYRLFRCQPHELLRAATLEMVRQALGAKK